jgi:hypothetical protein
MPSSHVVVCLSPSACYLFFPDTIPEPRENVSQIAKLTTFVTNACNCSLMSQDGTVDSSISSRTHSSNFLNYQQESSSIKIRTLRFLEKVALTLRVGLALTCQTRGPPLRNESQKRYIMRLSYRTGAHIAAEIRFSSFHGDAFGDYSGVEDLVLPYERKSRSRTKPETTNTINDGVYNIFSIILLPTPNYIHPPPSQGYSINRSPRATKGATTRRLLPSTPLWPARNHFNRSSVLRLFYRVSLYDSYLCSYILKSNDTQARLQRASPNKEEENEKKRSVRAFKFDAICVSSTLLFIYLLSDSAIMARGDDYRLVCTKNI